MRKTSAVIVAILLVVVVVGVLTQGSRSATVVAPTDPISSSPSTRIAGVATPTPTQTPAPVLRADGMATIAAPGGLVVWSAPGTRKAKAGQLLAPGAVVYLIGAPRHAHGFDWWQIQADFVPRVGGPFGWIHASDATHRSTLVPFAPDCPSSGAPIDQARLVAIGTLRSLACFGGRDITVRGDLACYDAAVDWAVGGASWMGPNYSCSLNEAFYVEGSVIAGLQGGHRPVTGWYDIRGHFDDSESIGCSQIPFGSFSQTPSGHPDPWAVMACRQNFVVTEATKLP